MLLKHTETNLQTRMLVHKWNYRPITMRKACEEEFSAYALHDRRDRKAYYRQYKLMKRRQATCRAAGRSI